MDPTVIECGSGIEQVVVYARGAVVTRRVTLPEALPDGAVELRVPGVTALAEAGSVRAICDGDREVTGLTARLVHPKVGAARGELRARVRALGLERERLEAQQRSLSALRAALAGTRLDPALSRWAKRLDPAARFADAAALSKLVGAEVARLDGQLQDLAEALEKNARAREAAEVAAAQAAPAETEGERRASIEVRVVLAAGGGRAAALAVEYVVREARWWPVYTARFAAAATKVDLALDALVAQATGEDWTRVRLALSTAHLANDARLPVLASLRFGRAQPAPKRGYRPPPEGLDALFEGHDRAAAQGEEQRRRAAAEREAGRPKPPAPAQPAILERGVVDTRAVFDAMPAPVPESASMTRAGGYGAPVGSAAPAGMPMAAGYAGAPPPPQARAKIDLKARLGKAKVEVAEAPAAAPSMAMPARKSAGMFARMAPSEAVDADDLLAEMEDGGGGGAAPEPQAPQGIEPTDAWLDFDALVLGDTEDRARRGRLVHSAPDTEEARLERAHRFSTMEHLPAPPFARDPLEERGRFDHRYDAAGTADVPAGARPHRVSVAAAATHAVPRFTAVPRETAEVYREAEVKNPFDAPLLGGPVDVFLDGALMTTAALSFVDRAGTLRIGLGVEERLRVARNARVEEASAGLLGGSLVVDHAVTVDLSSSLGHKANVEVLERVPVTDDKDIEIKLTYARPEHEKYKQADRGAPLRRGVRFTVVVPPGDKTKIEYGYRVTLPAKNEIVGGNRRE